jgi:hypothetical protein
VHLELDVVGVARVDGDIVLLAISPRELRALNSEFLTPSASVGLSLPS